MLAISQVGALGNLSLVNIKAGEGSAPPSCNNQNRLCSGLMKPDTHLGENTRQIEVSDDQTTSFLFR